MAETLDHLVKIERAITRMIGKAAAQARDEGLGPDPDVTPILAGLYGRYSFDVVPKLGGVVTGRADAYRYLVESIRKFPDQERFAAMVRAAGFERVQYRNLTGGIAALHSGWRI